MFVGMSAPAASIDSVPLAVTKSVESERTAGRGERLRKTSRSPSHSTDRHSATRRHRHRSHSSTSHSRSRSRSSKRHKHKRHRTRSRSRTKSRSPSKSRSSRNAKHRHRTRSRSRSRSRSPHRHRDHRRHRRDRSRSRSSEERRKSRSRERKERNEQFSALTPNPTPMHSNDTRRSIQVVTRDQRAPHHQPLEAGYYPPPPRDYRHYHDRHHYTDYHRDSARDSWSQDPLSRRPPPPPSERPQSLLSHVLPSACGKYAYVFLCMKGDGYAGGAIIGAYSLRRTGTKHSIVCMVTPDVTESCRERMRYVFTEVIEVPYLQYEVKPLRTQKQRNMYSNWVDAAFTKWNMLALVQYEKTLFVDADKICLSNMDHLFEEMSVPAGTFSSPWSQPFVQRKDEIAMKKTGHGTNRGRYKDARGMFNPYQYCTHNDRVTSDMVFRALTEQSFVVIGTVVLLSPNLEDYEQYKKMLSQLVPFGFPDCHSMMDEQSISFYFSIWKNHIIAKGEYGTLTKERSIERAVEVIQKEAKIEATNEPDSSASSSSSSSSTSSRFIPPALPANALSEWSYIHHCYNYVPWHRYWLDETDVPYIFHFFSEKPWSQDRNAYPDLHAWWELVEAFLKDESFPVEQREEIKKIFDQKNLATDRTIGCCWCKFSEESFMLPADNSWKNHNVFDGTGALQCPQLEAGFERNRQKRQKVTPVVE